jgi:hypothetical protein
MVLSGWLCDDNNLLAVFRKIRNFFVSFSIKNSCQTTNVSTFPSIRWYSKWIGVGPMAKMIQIVSLSQIMWRYNKSNLSPKNIVYIRSFLHQYLLESEYFFAHAAMIVYVRGSIYVLLRDSSKKGSWRQGILRHNNINTSQRIIVVVLSFLRQIISERNCIFIHASIVK